MKYSYTIMYVQNVQETLDFYKNAFGFEQNFITPEGDYGEVKSGETTLSFASIELGKTNVKEGFLQSKLSESPFGIEIAFITENLEQDYQNAVDAGAVIYEPITQKEWGQKIGYLRDNNGFLIELASPMDEA